MMQRNTLYTPHICHRWLSCHFWTCTLFVIHHFPIQTSQGPSSGLCLWEGQVWRTERHHIEHRKEACMAIKELVSPVIHFIVARDHYCYRFDNQMEFNGWHPWRSV